MPKISWITITTGALVFDSGYTTNACTSRLSCLIFTHSPCRGDFSRVCLAQSCPTAREALNNNAITAVISFFMAASLLLTLNHSQIFMEPCPPLGRRYPTAMDVGYLHA